MTTLYAVTRDNDYGCAPETCAIFSTRFKADAAAETCLGDVSEIVVDEWDATHEIRVPHECQMADDGRFKIERSKPPAYIEKGKLGGYSKRYNYGYMAISYDSAAHARELCLAKLAARTAELGVLE